MATLLRRVFCFLIGHPKAIKVSPTEENGLTIGYRYVCPRCGRQIGDPMNGPSLSSYFVIDHEGCEVCQSNLNQIPFYQRWGWKCQI